MQVAIPQVLESLESNQRWGHFGTIDWLMPEPEDKVRTLASRGQIRPARQEGGEFKASTSFRNGPIQWPERPLEDWRIEW
jgi:hypothetical protein